MDWDQVVPILNQNHQLILLDLLGYGDSTENTSGFAKMNFDSTYFLDLNISNLGLNNNNYKREFRYYFERKQSCKNAYPVSITTGATFKNKMNSASHLWDNSKF